MIIKKALLFHALISLVHFSNRGRMQVTNATQWICNIRRKNQLKKISLDGGWTSMNGKKYSWKSIGVVFLVLCLLNNIYSNKN